MWYRLQNSRYDRVASNGCFNKTGFESYVVSVNIYFNRDVEEKMQRIRNASRLLSKLTTFN